MMIKVREYAVMIRNGVLALALLLTGCAHLELVNEDRYYPEIDWISDLQYDPDEIKPMTFSATGCPQISVALNGKPFWLKFDFGCSKGFQLTTAVESQLDYIVLRETNTYNTDGTVRGRVKRIRLDSLEVFGERYDDLEGTLADWKIFSSLPYQGLISLEYFADYRFTQDYKRGRLALTKKPFPDALKGSSRYLLTDILDPPDWHKYGVYVLGKVNGIDSVIYIDNGSSKTDVDYRILSDAQKAKSDGKNCSAEVPISIGDLEFAIRNFRIRKIERGTDYQYPVRIKIGSDLLKRFVITIDRTENRNILIIHKNRLARRRERIDGSFLPGISPDQPNLSSIQG